MPLICWLRILSDVCAAYMRRYARLYEKHGYNALFINYVAVSREFLFDLCLGVPVVCLFVCLFVFACLQ